ncbi:D-glycero-beta-D-manno-heptose 1-phosphate adenylyltransferase, partial [Myxococcota bacterium]
SSRPTTHKLRVVAHNQQVLRIDREEKQEVSDTVVTDALEIIRQSVAEVDGIVCSDYQKGLVTRGLLSGLVELAGRRGLRVAVDPKGLEYARYRGIDVLTPNLAELGEGTGMSIMSAVDRDRAAAQALAVTGARGILVTCGRDGMMLYQRDADPLHVPALAQEVYDVTGAGDTVVAVFALGLFAGVALPEAARLANAAASIVVGKLGTAIVDRDELEARLGDVTSTEPRAVSLEAARQAVARARAAGKSVVTTNGCFDLLHPGHVAFLESARSLGDVLVVGINSDASVRKLKGAERPVLDQASRTRVVGALACVDYVVLFDEADPVALVKALRPDVHVKGADYPMRDIIEREAVEFCGGRVERIPLLEGWSTSAIVESIVKKFGK